MERKCERFSSVSQYGFSAPDPWKTQAFFRQTVPLLHKLISPISNYLISLHQSPFRTSKLNTYFEYLSKTSASSV